MKRFPVLNQQYGPRSERLAMPSDVPWEFAETFREQAMHNHGQTLERLAERGGLAPEEMWHAAKGFRLSPFRCTKQEAVDWLNSKLARRVKA